MENRVNSICRLNTKENFIRGGVRGGNNAMALFFGKNFADMLTHESTGLLYCIIALKKILSSKLASWKLITFPCVPIGTYYIWLLTKYFPLLYLTYS